jgi:hypothetical protein
MAMRRHALAWPTVAVGLTILAVALSGCGARSDTTTSAAGSGASTSASTPASGSTTASSTTASSTTPAGPQPLTVRPAAGTPRSDMQFSFKPGSIAGRQGKLQVSYSLNVLGPRRSGCVGLHQAGIPVSAAGRAVTTSVGPAQLHGSWCPGSYTARVQELARPYCAAGTMCPQFIRVAAVFGPAKFRISG